LDSVPFSRFSSTRNQGWLQSGALYASLSHLRVAEDCAKGFAFLQNFCPEAISNNFSAFLFFDKEGEFQQALKDCEPLGIWAKESSVEQVATKEPLIRGTTLQWVLEVGDRPFDTRMVLRRVVDKAVKSGVDFIRVARPEDLKVQRIEDRWVVSDGLQAVQSEVLVLACGAGINTILVDLVPGYSSPIEITKISVYSFHKQIGNSALICPRIEHAPNLVPFHIGDQTGVTICLTKADRPAKSSDDFLEDPQFHQYFLESIAAYFPGIRDLRSDVPGNTYMCQKINLRSDKTRSHFIVDHGASDAGLKNLFSFYPGKFTTSQLAAEDCVKMIKGQCTSHRSTATDERPGPVEIETQKFLGNCTHKLRVTERGVLTFLEE
jgi:hypothetical protein